MTFSPRYDDRYRERARERARADMSVFSGSSVKSSGSSFLALSFSLHVKSTA